MKVDTEHAEDRCVHETGPLSDGRVQPKSDMPKSWSVPGFPAGFPPGFPRVFRVFRVFAQNQGLIGVKCRTWDACLGGERVGGKRGRGSENKVPFVAAVEMHDGQPVRVRFDRVRAFSFQALRAWHAVALAPGAQVTSDGLIGFEVLQRDHFAHQTVQPPSGKAGTEVEPFRWLNTVLGNLQTALSGTHHAFAFRKYGHRYLADAQYRFNRRYRLAELPTRLAVALLQAKPRPAWDLRIPAEAWT